MTGTARQFSSDDELRAYYSAKAGRPLTDDEVVLMYAADRGLLTAPSRRTGPNWGRVALGVTIALIALAISVSSYQSASSGGGTYVIFWGAVVWGGWIALKGLAAE